MLSLDGLAETVRGGADNGAVASLHAAGTAGVDAVIRAYRSAGGRDEAERLDQVLRGFGAIAVPQLIALLRDPVLGGVAPSALGIIGDRRAVNPLIEATTSPDSFMRSAATTALGRLRDARAFDALLVRLDDPESRLQAIEALVRLRDKRAIPALRRHLEDPVPGIAKYAGTAIQSLEST